MADDARTTAFDQAAPPDERFDANASLGRDYRPTAGGLIPPEALRPVFDMINQGLEDAEMLKARNIIVFPDQRGQTGGVLQKREPNKRGMQSLFIDDLQVTAAGEYYEKPQAMGFGTLRLMCDQTPILSSVIMTRIRQVNRFCNVSEDGGAGFEIRHVDRKHVLTSDEKVVTDLLGKFIANCGWEWNARKRKKLRRDTFPQFMAKSMRDSLSMDAAPIETEWKKNRELGLDGFYAVDGETIRLCMEQGYQGDDEIFALQVVNGRVVTGYSHEQLIYEVRNPRTDVRLAGYGMAEPELMVRVVTGFLNAMTHNIRGFDENSIPKGMLHMSGDYSQEDMVAFKRYWNSMVKGINNSWALPVMISKDQESKASFESFGAEFNEMYFAKWMTFLTSIVCAIYGMDPTEINFESFAASKSSLSGDDTSEKLAAAKDKGLRPFMSYYEGMISDFIVSEFSPKYCFRWVGLDEEDGDKVWEAQKMILTVNELRAERGYEPYPNVAKEDGSEGPDIGTAPLNPALIAVWQQAVQPQPEAGGEFGGGQPEEPDQEDFGQVDGDDPGGVPPQDKPDKLETAPSQFGGQPPAEPSIAKSLVYRIGE